MDNFLRPLLLILAAVAGSLIAFGLIGIFVGPLVLGVPHTPLTAWVDGEQAETK